MKKLSAHLESFGCQMNAYDTEVIASMLEEEGFRTCNNPRDADVIIVNTCSVRKHAEDRAIGRLHELSRHRDAILVVCGCMAQRMAANLFSLVPTLRIVSGTTSYDGLPDAIRESIKTGKRFCLIEHDSEVTYSLKHVRRHGSPSRYLSVTRGCDNYCSYCIVPYLRGNVRSKDPDSIINEIGEMIESGIKEITLLGQNVMAYRHGTTGFIALLERVLDETAIERIRFLTSHPRDVNPALFRLIAEHERICPHIHLPVQSGSNRILELMRRGYTRERYLEIIHGSRLIRPDLAITTDIIVGFPTESESEFKETLDIVERSSFDSVFTFKYSPREGTAAVEMSDDVPLEKKKERLAVLNGLVGKTRKRILEEQLGSVTEILLDGQVQKGENQFWKGRTPHFRNVLISGDRLDTGDFVRVRLTDIRNYTLIGEEQARR